MSVKIPIETSARHIHINEEDFKKLFGEEAQLTYVHELSQPGQYLCKERLSIVGPRGTFENVAILGPFRKDTQIELSMTDTRKIGVPGVIRQSGDIKDTPGCTLIGPLGELTIDEGVIVAKRHIHMTTKDAEYYGVTNGQIVEVKVETDGRTTTFGDTVVRVSDSYALAMHIDTDEANAAGVSGSALGEIIL